MEKPVQFDLNNRNLYGIFHLPDNNLYPNVIVLMVIGGPQTRVGSHRLYVQLARYLYQNNISSFRFDYEGNGDADGDWAGYKYAAESISTAIDLIKKEQKSITQIIVWSLCDGATACMVYAAQNQDKISSLILCNPYLHNAQGQAKTIIKYYYIKRLLDVSFWKKIFSFKFNFKDSILSFTKLVKQTSTNQQQNIHDERIEDNLEIHVDDVAESIKKLSIPLKYILSTDDLAAKQFYDFLKNNSLRKNNISINYVRHADHTFSNSITKKRAFETTLKILNELS